MYPWETYRAYYAATKTLKIWLDFFFLSSLLPRSHVHMCIREKIQKRLARETTRTHSRTNELTHSHGTHTHTLAHTYSNTHIHTYAHTHTRIRTHTHTRTLTHILANTTWVAFANAPRSELCKRSRLQLYVIELQ